MQTNKLKLLTQFIANLFAGAIFTFIAIWILLLKFGFDFPSDSLVVILVASTLGTSISALISGKYKYKAHVINLILFLVLPVILTLVMGFEDWAFSAMMSLSAIIHALLPAIIITVIINWRQFSKKKN